MGICIGDLVNVIGKSGYIVRKSVKRNHKVWIIEALGYARCWMNHKHGINQVSGKPSVGVYIGMSIKDTLGPANLSTVERLPTLQKRLLTLQQSLFLVPQKVSFVGR